MRLERLTCNSCGAPLEVPQTANFVTCNHCSAQLAVRRQDNVTFTEQLDQLTKQTEELSERVDRLSEQGEVASLDRQWELERENYLVSDKHGGRHIPSEGGAIGGGIVITIFGCFWTAMAIGITSGAPNVGPFAVAKFAFPAFGVLFVCAGIAMSVFQFSKAGAYRRAKQRYKRRRSDLLREKQS